MQEFRYFRGGACLAISLEGLEWLCKRKCSDKEIKKRDGKALLWISKGHVVPSESELQPFHCNYICGNTTKVLRQPTDCPLPAQLSCTLERCKHRPTSTSLPSLTLKSAKNAPWTVFFNMLDDFNLVSPQKTVAKSPKYRFLILCYESILGRLFCDIFDTQDSWPVGNTGLYFCQNNNEEDDLNPVTKNTPDILNSLEKSRRGTTNRGGIYSYFFDRSHMEDMSGRSIKRKSVSFADDVIVYLFDQESPTVELHPGPYNSVSSSSSCLHSDATFDDNGLEWEDDFLALEKNCHSHSFSHSTSRCYALSLPTKNLTECKPGRFFLSQSCLFLTHVTESDLEL